ncbi:hypothetical protein GC169_10920 [bacterium]|nr:hypothetical protein [bacterium]
MTRFHELIDTVARHQELAEENYRRVRLVAEGVRSGLCEYLDARDGECVRLVPPAGPFQPRSYTDEAFSMPPRGLRAIGPVVFGLAIRVSRGTDWVRLVLRCTKEGEQFRVDLAEGKSHVCTLPFTEADHQDLYEMIYRHLLSDFEDQVRDYQVGQYGGQEIGFDVNEQKGAEPEGAGV